MDETQDEAEIIRIGEEAVRLVGQTFERWLDVARALEIGRHWAMMRAGTNQPIGRGYNEAFKRWLEHHRSFAEPNLKESTRSWLYKCYERRHEILKWREDRGPSEMARYNYPETVYKRWEKAVNPKADADDDKPKPIPATQLRRELEAAQAHTAELEGAITRLREERNQRIDVEWDPVAKIVGSLRASKRWSEIWSALTATAAKQEQTPKHGRGIKALDDPTRPRNRGKVTDSAGTNGKAAPRSSGRKPYPFPEMKIGDSFVDDRPQPAIAAAASGYSKRHGVRFVTKKVGGSMVEVTRTE